jgi:hypothetical protein
MGFWDLMRRADSSMIGFQGEAVMIGEHEVTGQVTDLRVNPELAPGGTSAGVVFLVRLEADVAAGIEDGAAIEVRGERGKVTAKNPGASSTVVEVGPANRWDGEFPGA